MALDFLLCLAYNLQEKVMKNSIRHSIWTIALICTFVSCSRYSLDELLSAPEKIEIHDREYILETVLFRSFRMIGDPSGLCGPIFVVALDSLQFPSSLDADHIWVINGSDVWDTGLKNREIPYGYEYKMKKWTKEEGPDWGPDIYVNVVVEVVNDENGSYLLRADSQLIGRLD